EQRLVSLEQAFVLLDDVVVDHEITRAGQVFQGGEGDLLAGLGEPLSPSLDDARDRNLLESARGAERRAGVRGEPLHVLGVPREWMAGDVEPEGLLLQREPLALAPLFLAEDALLRRLVRRLGSAAEEPELARLSILLRRRALLQRSLDALEQRPARLGGEVEGAGGDERLDHLLVDLAGVDASAEIEQARERLASGREDGLDGVLAYAFDGAEPE